MVGGSDPLRHATEVGKIKGKKIALLNGPVFRNEVLLVVGLPRGRER
jgi:hypothetical protein